MSVAPIRYSPSVEQVQPDEEETIKGMEEAFRHILETTSKDYGRAVRAVHAKAHGIARGTLTIAEGLPAEYAQGIFAAPGQHEAVIRISTNPGDILDDAISLPRGLALKILGVSGERLPGAQGDSTQDFVMVNGPVFVAPDPKAFLKNLKLLARTTDRAEGAKKAISSVFQVIEGALESVGLESGTLKALGGVKPVHPLGETYFSQTAFRYGDHIAKFALFPVAPALTALTGTMIDAHGRPDAIREEVRSVMLEQGGTWELRVQLNRDLAAMPVEDPTVEWTQEDSPFVTVARLEVAPQLSWETGGSEKTDDALAYSVWNGVAAHQPLGGINRVRRETYKFSQDFRGSFNGCPLHQPERLAELA